MCPQDIQPQSDPANLDIRISISHPKSSPRMAHVALIDLLYLDPSSPGV
jgi:hypothetical protein